MSAGDLPVMHALWLQTYSYIRQITHAHVTTITYYIRHFYSLYIATLYSYYRISCEAGGCVHISIQTKLASMYL